MAGRIINGDVMDASTWTSIPDGSVQCCVTSPPYWSIRDYGVDGQVGMEKTPAEYVDKLVLVFRKVRRKLTDDGVLWLNLGDSYASRITGNGGVNKTGLNRRVGGIGEIQHDPVRFDLVASGLKPKDLVGFPWMVAFALRNDGWYLRQDVVWFKQNVKPESVKDRCTKAHEYVFMLSKSGKYYYDQEAIKDDAVSQDGKRNRRSVWLINNQPFYGAHFAVFPPKLAELCILSGSKKRQTVLDPFFGAGTVGVVAKKTGRHYIGVELSSDNVTLATNRIKSS